MIAEKMISDDGREDDFRENACREDGCGEDNEFFFNNESFKLNILSWDY